MRQNSNLEEGLMTPPSIYDRWMEEAFLQAIKSQDPSTQNGAVIAVYDEFLETCHPFYYATGYNRFACDTSPEWEDRSKRLNKITHAEEDAVFMMAEMGEFPKGKKIMFAVWASCAPCARMIVRSGVKELVRMPLPQTDRWRESIEAGDEILKDNGIKITEYPKDRIFGYTLRFSGKEILL